MGRGAREKRRREWFMVGAVVLLVLVFAGISYSQHRSFSGKWSKGVRSCPAETGDELAMEYGVAAPNLELADFHFQEVLPDGSTTKKILVRRGMVAKKRIAYGDTIMTAPFTSFFDIQNAEKSKIGFLIPQLREKGWDDMDVIILFLMFEYLNPPSVWDSYICSMPKEFTTTVYWTENQIKAGSKFDPSLKDWTDSRYAHFLKRYNDRYPLLFKDYGHMFKSSQYNFRLFLWAANAAYSRNWAVARDDGENTHVMIPYADMINHKNPSGWVNYNTTSKEFTIYAGEDYEAGEEVFISYGDKCNTQLLVDYGFSMEGNQSPCD